MNWYQDRRFEVLERDGHKCRDCGSIKNLECHHIIPREFGGTDEKENLKTLCKRCHVKLHAKSKIVKHNKTFIEYRKVQKNRSVGIPKKIMSLLNLNEGSFLKYEFITPTKIELIPMEK